MSPRTPASRSERAARSLLVAALAFTVAVLALAAIPARPLGHDEAVYALGARGLWSGDTVDEFPLHRSIGMRVLAAPGLIVGAGDERVLRLPFALIAVGYLLVVYRVTRRWWNARAAALATALIATNAVWLWRAAEALSDIPSALALLGFTALCAGGDAPSGSTDRRAGRAAAAAALAALACYLRYASTPVVALVLAIAFVSDPPRRRWLVAVAAGTLVLLLPFLWWSLDRTGSPLGVLAAGDRMGNRRYYGEGLVYYLRTWPFELAGPVCGAAAGLGLVVGLRAWSAGLAAAPPATRARRLFATAALGQLLLLGWRAHGEARFVFFALTGLAIVGASWLADGPRRWRAAVIAVVLTAVPAAVVVVVHVDRMTARRRPLVEASAAIRGDAAGRPCVAYATEAPMTAWYAHCVAIQVDNWGLDVGRLRATPPPVYLVEAKGLPRSLAPIQTVTAAAIGWAPVACAPASGWCVWRASASAR